MIKNLDEYLEMQANRNEVVGSWGFSSNLNFTRMKPEETNIWFFEQVFNFLRSFFGLVVPDSMEIITYNATKQVKRQNLDQQTFLDELMLVMKGLKQHLWTIRLNLNIVGFLRTKNRPDDPVRLQIKEPCTFIVWGGPDESGFQSFSITYNLFSTTILDGEDQMLWSINQPVLEKALRKWEQQTGQRINVVDSNSAHVPVNRYGFGAPRSRPGFAAPPPPPPPPQARGKDPFAFEMADDEAFKAELKNQDLPELADEILEDWEDINDEAPEPEPNEPADPTNSSKKKDPFDFS